MAEQQAEQTLSFVFNVVQSQDRAVQESLIDNSAAQEEFVALEEGNARFESKLDEMQTSLQCVKSRHSSTLLASIERAKGQTEAVSEEAKVKQTMLDEMQTRRTRKWEKTLNELDEKERDLGDFEDKLKPEALNRIHDDLSADIVGLSELGEQTQRQLAGFVEKAAAPYETEKMTRACAVVAGPDSISSDMIDEKLKRVAVVTKLIKQQQMACVYNK